MDGTGAGCWALWLGKGSYKHTCPVQRGDDYQRQTSNADFNADGMLQDKFQRQNSNADGRPFQRRWDASRFQRRWEPPVLLLNGCPLQSKSLILLHSTPMGNSNAKKIQRLKVALKVLWGVGEIEARRVLGEGRKVAAADAVPDDPYLKVPRVCATVSQEASHSLVGAFFFEPCFDFFS